MEKFPWYISNHIRTFVKLKKKHTWDKSEYLERNQEVFQLKQEILQKSIFWTKMIFTKLVKTTLVLFRSWIRLKRVWQKKIIVYWNLNVTSVKVTLILLWNVLNISKIREIWWKCTCYRWRIQVVGKMPIKKLKMMRHQKLQLKKLKYKTRRKLYFTTTKKRNMTRNIIPVLNQKKT